MHVLIAPDSFKDALSAREAAEAIRRGLQRALPEAALTTCPLGDGGEGTLEAVLAATRAERRNCQVHDALGRPRQAGWGWIGKTRTAIVELAEASGLQHLSRNERDATQASTLGVGELILAALDEGAEHLILTLGGSATNDGGTGMMTALGIRFLDANDQPLPPGGGALTELHRIDDTNLDPRLARLTVEAAVDVDNPLCGERGASAVFGPQKGADADTVRHLDQGLAQLADCMAQRLEQDPRNTPGAGAAGGMGYAALAFFGARLKPGIELVMETVGFEQLLQQADLVVTGEGQLDGQSLAGKTPIGVARLAHRHSVPTVALVGRLGEGWQAVHEAGITAAFALADGPLSLDEALSRCSELLADRAESIARLVIASRERGPLSCT
ncbi:glycerate kinase [Kushneria phosphatilytica]|uniref:Glycerate kinase n=1 Tax=Kushneria phosphatilytica TaxID=657387 RepID=A0A1S1NRT2_9GAMM|nr:glycerate kinase [Kushneria phosphatilytica]OHV07639.1 glycerate kinase [Kushneria phosphatilytica]QEL10129.1 glycerate kinase [Kushneria phosphatilytica]